MLPLRAVLNGSFSAPTQDDSRCLGHDLLMPVPRNKCAPCAAQVKLIFGYSRRPDPASTDILKLPPISFPRHDPVNLQLGDLLGPTWTPYFKWREFVMGMTWLIILFTMKEIGKRNKCGPSPRAHPSLLRKAACDCCHAGKLCACIFLPLTHLPVDCASGLVLWLWAVYILFLQARVHGSYRGLRCQLRLVIARVVHHLPVLKRRCRRLPDKVAMPLTTSWHLCAHVKHFAHPAPLPVQEAGVRAGGGPADGDRALHRHL